MTITIGELKKALKGWDEETPILMPGVENALAPPPKAVFTEAVLSSGTYYRYTGQEILVGDTIVNVFLVGG